jgi:type II secretory pathway predicted ATPase ExeA
MDGQNWETNLHFLARRLVTVSRCLVNPDEAPWMEHEGKKYELHLVDPVLNSVHLDQLGLSDEPFSKEIDDEHLWIPPSKQEIVDDIVETIESRQSAGVIGEPGVGKTCVLRAVRRTLPPERFRLTYYHAD